MSKSIKNNAYNLYEQALWYVREQDANAARASNRWSYQWWMQQGKDWQLQQGKWHEILRTNQQHMHVTQRSGVQASAHSYQ
jgi:hypothetical protein